MMLEGFDTAFRRARSMSSQPLEQKPASVGASDMVSFAGDQVRLAGQMDYPATPLPAGGYPLMFVIPHATCTTRHGFAHFARLGTEAGIAVFRWDKRGTGGSGSGGMGSPAQDTLNAYQTALSQRDIDRTQVIILAQNEGTLMLSESYEWFTAVQKPAGVILVGNMVDENDIALIKTPVLSVISKNDWNAWQIYAEAAVKAHRKATHQPSEFFVAPNTDRRLMYDGGNAFHRGAANAITEWLLKMCPAAVRPAAAS
jgi:hypothetical protein